MRVTNVKNFTPSPETQRAFRDCLGCFGTGVCVITTQTDDGPLAITANSFSAVSLEPPLVLWSLAKSSKRHKPFVEAQHTSIHIMCSSQLENALSFARNGRHFDHMSWDVDANGTPILEGCLARFDCTPSACHTAGDHTILVALVENANLSSGRPLMFAQGAYGTIQANS